MDGSHVDLFVELGGGIGVVHVIAVREVLHAKVQQTWGRGGAEGQEAFRTIVWPQVLQLWEPQGAGSDSSRYPLEPPGPTLPAWEESFIHVLNRQASCVNSYLAWPGNVEHDGGEFGV